MIYDPFEQSPEKGAPGKQEQRRRSTDMVRRFMKRSDEYRKPFLALAERARDMYQCWELQSKSVIQRANLRLPYAYLIVQSQLPDVYNALMKNGTPFRVKGRKLMDAQYENAINDFHESQLAQMRFAPKFVSFLTGLLIDGTAVTKFPYVYKEQVVTKRETVQDPMLPGVSYPKKTQSLEVMFDGPGMENVPLVDFFPDWAVRSAGDIQGMRGCVHRTYKTLAELKEMGDIYQNLDELEWSVSRKGSDAWAEPYYKGDFDRYSGAQKDSLKKKPVEIWEYWGLFDKNGDGVFTEYLITVANGDVVIRCEENFYDWKFKPFAAAVNVAKDNDFYGISELFAVRGNIKEATTLRNARLDQVNLAVNRMWLVDRGSGINAKALYSRPSGLIYTNDINGLKPIDPPEVPGSSFREIQELTSEIQTTVGTSSGPNLSQAGHVFGRSATGAAMVSSIASARATMKARLVSDLYLHDVCQIMLKTNAQFVSEDQWVKATDPNVDDPFMLLPREVFHTDYDFEPIASLDSDPQQDAQKLEQALQWFQAAEQTQPGTIKWDVVFQTLGRDLLGRDSKRFVRTDQERQQMQMQKMAAEQQVNSQIGQMAPQPNAAGGQGTQT